MKKKMKNLYLGDIHGNFSLINQYVDLYGLKNTNIIQVGDFGIGFRTFFKDKRYLSMYHPKLVKNNVFVYAIRGNHDYKPYFDNDPFGFTNIKFIKDYTVLNLADQNILFVGGAISVDRKLRTDIHNEKNHYKTPDGFVQWWKDEEFVLDEKKIETITGVDVVVTHTAPTYCYPYTGNGFGSFVENIIKDTNDVELRTELLYERNQLDQMFNILKVKNNIKYNFYGHFHRSQKTDFDGIRHILLDIGELWQDMEQYYNSL